MNDGLDISEKDFMNMRGKDQNLVLFKNMVYIRGQLKEYKLHKKITYWWLSALTIFTGIKKFIGL